MGDYVVTEVKDNHHVYCRKLQNSQYEEDGIVVDFYRDKLFSHYYGGSDIPCRRKENTFYLKGLLAFFVFPIYKKQSNSYK